jgi:uncharacterized phage-associated protein
MISAHQVADYFLTLSDEEESISNLKLQKLLYYAQGIHLALTGDALFSENITAWAHGPVVVPVYHRFKEHGAQGIPRPDSADISAVTDSARSILDEVWSAYGQFSAWRLREMTHAEPPWRNTAQSAIIDLELMREYFSTQIVTAP